MKLKHGFILGAALAIGAIPALSACNAEQHAMWITIWAANEAKDLTSTQAKRWAKQMAEEYGADIGIRVSAVGEGDAASNMITDVQAGADLYCFAQDQLARLRSAGALKEIVDASAKQALIEANDDFSISGATVGDALVAYPLTSDNGYFLYYDKSVLSEADVKDIETIIAKCEDAGKNFYFNAGSAWYNAAFFYGFGCESTWYSNDDGTFYDYTDTYRSKEGIKACKAIYNLVNTHKSIFVDDSTGSKAFAKNVSGSLSAAACVSGIWDYNAIAGALGENFGAAELPYVTVGEERVHLSSFKGCKYIGAKPQENPEKAAYSEMLAEYLTGEECQLERSEVLHWGPSNKNAQKSDVVKNNPALSALAKQNEYAVGQGQYPGDWWSLAGGITASLADEKCKGTDTEINNILTKYKGAIDSLRNGEKQEQ